MLDREIFEGAEALKEIARIGRGIPLSIVEAREGARAVLRAAERVRAVGERACNSEEGK